MHRALLHTAGRALVAPRQHHGFRRPPRATRRCSTAAGAHSVPPGSYGDSFELPDELDAVVVPAGGLLPDGTLPEWVTRRLDAAAGAWAASARAGRPLPVLVSGGGTPHKPPVLSPAGYVIHEATACAAYLMHARGLPGDAILKEWASYDTLGNAAFTLQLHAAPLGWRRALVITSVFHMPRTRHAFDLIWGRLGSGCSPPTAIECCYWAVSDAGLDGEMLAARREREAASMEAQRRLGESLSSPADLHASLYRTHKCYAAGRQAEWERLSPAASMNDKALASY